jgi:hypothetical protein
MKTRRPYILLVAMAIFAIPHSGKSQVSIKVEQVKETMSKGENVGFKVMIPQATTENVKRAWIKQLEADTKAEALESGYEITIAGAVAPEISPNPVNIYSMITDIDSTIQILAFFEIDSAFFDPETYPDKLVKDKILNSITNYLRRFAVEQYKNAVEDELKMEEDKLKDLSKQLSDLENDQEKAEKSIKEEESNISSADDEIKALKAQSTQQGEQVTVKRLANLAITDKEAKKTAEKELKDLEKAKDKTDKDIEKLEKDKVTSKNNIEDHNKTIEESVEQQELLSGQIEEQEAVVVKVEAKLKGIK